MRGNLELERRGYYAGRFLAQVSQNLLFAGLFLFAGATKHAGLGVGNLFVAMLIPAIAFGLAGGAIVDRLGPGRGYVAGALLRFLPALAGVFFLDGAVSSWAIAFLYSAGSQVFSPAEMAMVKVVDQHRPGRSHSFIVFLQAAAQGLGIVVLAPAMYFLGGPRAIVMAGAVGYGALTVIALWLASRRLTSPPRLEETHAFSFRTTLNFFRSDSRARDAVATMSLRVVTTRAIMVVFPFYLEHDMGVGKEWTVYLLIPGVIGALVGLVWTSRTVTLARAPRTMRMAIAGFGVGTFALAVLDYTLTRAVDYSQIPPLLILEAHLNTTFLVALPVAFLLGLSLMFATVGARVALTEAAPLNQQARVFAMQLWLTETLIIFPMALTGLGTEYAGARPTLAAVAIFALLTLVAMDATKLRARLPRRAAEATSVA